MKHFYTQAVARLTKPANNNLFKKACLVMLFVLASFAGRSATYYWVGGTGSWSQIANWSLVSGTNAYPSIVPSINDDVVFDANSGFTSTSKTITLDAIGYCHNITFTGNGVAPILALGSNTLQISGSVAMQPGVMVTGQGTLNFTSTSLNETFKTGGDGTYINAAMNFSGGAAWTFTDSSRFTGAVQLTKGSFDFSGKYMSMTSFVGAPNTTSGINASGATFYCGSFSYSYTGTGTLGTLNIANANISSNSWKVSATPMTSALTAGSTITMGTGNTSCSFTAKSGDVYNNLVFVNTSSGTTCSVSYGTFNKISALPNQPGISLSGVTTDSLVYAANSINSLAGCTISKYWSAANPACSGLMQITGLSSTTWSTITAGAKVEIANAQLQNVKLLGLDTPYVAINSIDLGGNKGITIGAYTGKALYWVGNSGNWNDAAHWALTSGGAAGSGCVPTQFDKVIFDANSFTANARTVSLTGVPAVCDTMIWQNCYGNPTLSADVQIGGSLTLQAGMTVSGALTFVSNRPAETLTTGTTTATNAAAIQKQMSFNGTAAWTLNGFLSNTNSSLSVSITGKGSFDFNGNNATLSGGFNAAGSVKRISAAGSAIKCSNWSYTSSLGTLNIANATITCVGWTLNAQPLVADSSAGSTIINSANFNTNAGDRYNMLFQRANMNNFVNGIFRSITVDVPGVGITPQNVTTDSLVLAANSINTFYGTSTVNKYWYGSNPDCSGLISLYGNPGAVNITAGAVVKIANAQIKNLTVSGPDAPFTAANSFDLLGNGGLTITLPTTKTLYWVGAAGNWNDKMHWALTSGGTGGVCVPTQLDDVIFDAGSGFTTSNNTVSLTGAAAYCNNMTWQNCTVAPTLSAAVTIYGSLTLQSGMTVNSSLTFKSTRAAETFVTGGATTEINSSVYFTTDAAWTVVGDMNVTFSNGFSFSSQNNGSINFTGSKMNAGFTSISTATGTVKFAEGSTINCYVNNRFYFASTGTGLLDVTNVTFNGAGWSATGGQPIKATGSQINLTTTNTTGLNFNAKGGDVYNIVNVNLPAGASSTANFTITGTGSARYNKITFKSGNSQFEGVTVDSLILVPGSTNTFSGTININKYLYAGGNPCFQSYLTGINAGKIIMPASAANLPGRYYGIDYVHLMNMGTDSTSAYAKMQIGNKSFNDLGNSNWNIIPYVAGTAVEGLGADTALYCNSYPYTITTTLFFGGPNTTYKWDDGSFGLTRTVTKPGNYYVDVDYAGDGTCPIHDTIHITTVPNPTLKGSVAFDCSKIPITLTASGLQSATPSAEYTLTAVAPAGAIVTPVTQTSPNFNFLRSDNIASATFKVKDLVSGCESSTTTVNITPLTPLPVSTGNTSICINSTSQLSNTQPAGSWSSLDPSVATVSASGLVTAVASGNARILYTASNKEGCTLADTVKISVAARLATPTAVAIPAAICAGSNSTITVTAAGATAYSIDNGVNWQASNQFIVTPATTTTYSQLVASVGGTCASDPASPVTVTVKQNATAADLNVYDVTICAGVKVTLTASSTTVINPVFKWYSGSTLGTPIYTGSKFTSGTAINSPVSYYVTVEGDNVCEGSPAFAKKVNVAISSACSNTDPAGCSATGTLLFREDFGGNDPSDPDPKATGIPQVTGLTYTNIVGMVGGNPSPTDGQYTLTKKAGSGHSGWWQDVDDHTSPNDLTRGYMLMINADEKPSQFYDATLDKLCSGTNLFFSAWAYNINKNGTRTKPNITFILINPVTGDTLTNFQTGDIKGSSTSTPAEWKQYGFNFTVPDGIDAVRLKIVNNAPGGAGNDFCLDDIEVYACTPPVSVTNLKPGGNYCAGDNLDLSTDFSDATTSLGTPLTYKWYYSATNNPTVWSTWTAIGSTKNLSTPAVAGYYRVVAGSATNMAAGNFNCMAASAPVQVAVNALPATPTTMATPAAICVGSSSEIEITSADAVSYSIDNGTTWQANNKFTVSPASTKIYDQVIVKNASGCVSPVANPVTVTVNPIVITAIGGGAINVCIGAATPAFTANTAGGAWSINPASIASIDPVSGVVTGIATGTATITYTPLASSCAQPATVTISVKPNVTLDITSALNPSGPPDGCINAAIIPIEFTTGNGATGVTITAGALPAGVTGSYDAALGKYTISGVPTVSGAFQFTVTTEGGCSAVSVGTQLVIHPRATITDFTVNNASICSGNAATVTASTATINNATFNWYSDATLGTLLTTTTGSYSPSPAPVVNTDYYVTVQGDNVCESPAQKVTVVIKPDATIVLDPSSIGNPIVCVNKMLDITFNTTNVTSVTAAGLPNGVTGNFDATTGKYSLTGSPTEVDFFNYVVTATADCPVGGVTAGGVIIVRPDATITLNPAYSADQSVCINNAIAPIEYTTANTIAVDVQGLPAGVIFNYVNENKVIISGTPTQSGTFNYKAIAKGVCRPDTLYGVITVKADANLSLTSPVTTTTQSLCLGTAFTDIMYQADNATAATVTGLPNGIDYSFSNGKITISGASTVSGVFTYTVNATGDCKAATPLSGTITIKDKPTIGAVTPPVAICEGNAITVTVPTIQDNGAAITSQGWYLNGVAFNPATILTYDYNGKQLTYQAINGCNPSNPVSSDPVTLQVKPYDTLSLKSAVNTDNQSICLNSNLTPITYQGSTGVTNVKLTSGVFPAGITGSYDPVSNTYTISGVPTGNNGTFSYTLTTEGAGCKTSSLSGTIIVNKGATITDILQPVALCAGSTLNLVAPVIAANGSTISKQYWVFGGAALDPSVNSITVNYPGDNNKALLYRVEADCGNINSNTVTLTVNDKPSVADIQTPPPVCGGSGLELVDPVVSGNGLSISTQGWYLNGTEITSATKLDPTYNGSNLQYRASNSCGTGASNTVTIEVRSLPIMAAVPDQSVLAGATTASVNFSGNLVGITYNWTNDNTSIGLPASGAGDIAAFTAVNNGTTTQTATITVSPKQEICTGASVVFHIIVDNRSYISWKTADKTEVKAGDLITYTIHVKNTGSTTLNHITVSDPVPAYTTYVSGGTYNSAAKTVIFDVANANLLPNSNTEATFSFVVKAADNLTGAGSITNVAHVTSDGGDDSPTDCVNAPTGANCGGSIPVDNNAHYTSWKTADKTIVQANDDITYTIHFKNTGSVAINNITVTDPVPAHTTYVSGGTYNSGNNTVTFSTTNTSLIPGDETAFNFVVKAASDLTGVTSITNVATVKADNGGDSTTDCKNAPAGTIDCGGNIPTDGNAHYISWKTADKAEIKANDDITYTIHVKNTGSVTINNITVTDPVPTHTAYVSGGTYNSGTNTVSFNTTNAGVTPGNETAFSFVVKAAADLTGVTSITNVATVNGGNGDSTTNCDNAPPGTPGCGGVVPVDNIPHYTSWKTADKSEIKVNDDITYTIHFKNTGSVAINNITVTDPVPTHTTYVSGGTYNNGTNAVTFSTTNANLLPNDETTFSFVVKAAADLTGVTSITNVATVNGGNGDSTTNCNNAPAGTAGCGGNIPVDNNTHYTSWKTADKSEIKANDDITYTIHFKNTGSVAINNITVSDPVPAHTSYVSGGAYNSGTNTVTFSTTNANLLPNDETTFSFVVKAASDLTGVTSITNVATVNGGNGDSATNCNNAPAGTIGCGGNIPTDGDAHYTSWKTADKTIVQANDDITYTIHFKNTGSVAINNITVTDPVPTHTTYVSGGTYNGGRNTVTFTSTNASLVPGNEATFSFVVKAAADLTGVTSIVNVATVKGDNGGDSTTNCDNAPAGTIGCGGNIPTDADPHYVSWKTADRSEIKVNDDITYTIHFKNTGSVAINNITVTDPVPTHTTYVSGGTYNSGTNTVTFGTTNANLLPNDETTFSFVVKAASDLTGVTSITNVATVNGGNGDSTTNCNNAPAGTTGCGGNVPVDNKPHYASWKTADKTEIKANDEITYTIHFKNTGSVAINTITITDPVPTHTTYVSGGTYNNVANTVTFTGTNAGLTPGNEASFSFVVKAAADLTGVTSVTNVATVNGDNGGDSTTNCNNAPAGTAGCGGNIPVDTKPHYVSWKTADKQTIKENDQITYTIHFKNTGSVAINNINITDPIPAHTSYVSGGTYNSSANTVTFTGTNAGLTPGNEATFNFVVKAATDLTGITGIINVATVNGDNGGDSTTNCNNAPAGTTGCGGNIPVDDNIIGAGPVCVNATLSLRTTVTGGVWSSSNAAIAQVNVNTGVVTGISAGTATISYKANSKTVTADVTVNPLPVVPAITGKTDICIDGGGALTNAVTGGAWSSVNTAVVTIDANTGVMKSISAGSSNITYTVTNANTGCQTIVETTVTVYAQPVVPAITGATQVCQQSTIQLSNTNTLGVWNSSDNTIATVDNTGKVTGVNNGTVDISYTVTNAGSCATTVKTTITVNKKPVVTTTAIAAVCSPGTVDLKSGISNYDANNYTYTFTDATGVVVANPAAVSATGTYNVVAENKASFCSSDPQALQVKINAKPVVNVVTLTPGEVCAPSTVNIQSLITNYDATKYNYSYTDQYGNAIATPTAVNASGNYIITATDKVNDTHCSSQPVTVAVTVNPQPVITVVNNGNMALCGNTGTVDLTTGITNYNANYTYTFTDASGSPLSNVSAIGLPGTYYVTAKDAKCSSVKAAITLTRYATPVVTVTDPAAVYDPYTVDITAPAVTAGSTADLNYSYYNSSNVLLTNAEAQKISGPGSYTYYIQGTSAQGCKSNTAPVHVMIKDRPVLSISSAEIWEGQSATLTISLPTGVTLPDAIAVKLVTQRPGSTIMEGDYGKPGTVTIPANTNNATFTINTWDNNILDLDRILILGGANTTYNVTPGAVLIHDSTSLKPQNLVITIGRDTIYGRGSGAVSVSLPIGISTSYPIQVAVHPASGTTINSTDYTMDNTVTIQPGNGSAILGVSILNTAPEDRKLNLSGTSTGFVVKDGGVYIRQSRINVVPLVSDNGDGINDFLKIEGIEKYTSKMGGSNKVILFSRWEDVIYEANNYDNAAIKFDGRGNIHGAGRVPDGVYFYAITITIPDNELGVGESKTQTFKGYFRLQK